MFFEDIQNQPKLYKQIFQNYVMGTTIIKMRIMPKSLDTNLGEVEKRAKNIITKETKSEIKVEKEPVAFGLNAIILTFTWDEDKSIDNLQDNLKKIPNTSSAEVIDFRRALG